MRGSLMQFAKLMVAVAFLAGWTEVAGAATITVNVMSNFFSPSAVSIMAGDTVQWVWQQGSHTSTSNSGLWDSGILTTGSTFQFTFNQPGDFDYICSLHFNCCNMAGTVHVSPSVSPAAAQLLVSAPAGATAGSPIDVTVTAVDSTGNVVPSYTGTVAFSSTDPFPAVLPANYTFTSNDQGAHTFSAGVTLFTAGSQTLTVQDTATSTIMGSAAVTVTAGATAQVAVGVPLSSVAGVPFDVTVTLRDSDGNIMTGYTGTVTFSSSDPYPGVLPADYTFTPNDQGVHTFSGGATFFTAGAQTLTAQDTATSSLAGSATVGVVAALASQFLATVPATAVSGTAFDVTLAALDPYGNVATSYGGTVAWTSSDTDPGALLPANYTFQTTDNGMATFPAAVTLVTLGNQTLTATDTVSGITGSATVTVGSGP